MKLLKFFKFVLFFFLLNFHLTYAEEKTAFIDLDYAVKNSNLGKSLLIELDELNNVNIKKLKLKETELKKIENEIKKKQNIISKEELDSEIKSLNIKLKEYRSEKDILIANLEKKRNQNLSIFLKQVTPIIQKYMDENSIKILLDRKNVFMGKKNSDITENIVKEINKKFK